MEQITSAYEWARENWDAVLAVAGAAYLLVSAVVAATPTPKDDEALARFVATLRRWSFLAPWGSRRVFSMPGTDPLDGNDDDGPGPSAGGALVALLIASVTVLQGCGGGAGVRTTRHALNGGSDAVIHVDSVVADLAREMQAEVEAHGCDAECELRALQLRRVSQATHAAARALLAIQAGVDAWEAGADCGLRSAIRPAVEALSELIAAIEAAGIDVPEDVSSITDTIRALATLLGSGECSRGEP